jgi:lipoprotein
MLKFKTLNLKLKVISISVLILIGCVGYEVHNWTKSYQSMERQAIQNFDTLWSTIWDDKTKTFNDKLDQNMIQSLEQYASTPTYVKKLKLAKSSVGLNIIENNVSTLNQLLSATNTYYELQEDDNDFKEQEEKNKNTVEKIETLIKTINDNNSLLTYNNKEFSLSEINPDVQNLSTISTDIKWKDLSFYNKNIEDLKKLYELQQKENQTEIEQQAIIDLKSKLDEFVKLSKEYETNIKNDYVTIKDLKEILNSLNQISSSVKDSYFTNLKDYASESTSTSYKVHFSDELFNQNQILNKFKNHLSQIEIDVQFKADVTTVTNKNDEKSSQTLKLNTNTSLSDEKDDDLVNVNSLKNIKLDLIQNQTIKKFRAEVTTTTEENRQSNSAANPSTSNRNQRSR